MRRVASHYVYRAGELVPDAVVTVDDSGTVVAIESHARIDSMCSVEFYSGILIPEMVMRAVDWTGCGNKDFVLARLRGDGVRITDGICPDEPFEMRRLTQTHSLNLFMERYGTSLHDVLMAVACEPAGFCAGVRCGVVLLTGVDYLSQRLLAHASTERIV